MMTGYPQLPTVGPPQSQVYPPIFQHPQHQNNYYRMMFPPPWLPPHSQVGYPVYPPYPSHLQQHSQEGLNVIPEVNSSSAGSSISAGTGQLISAESTSGQQHFEDQHFLVNQSALYHQMIHQQSWLHPLMRPPSCVNPYLLHSNQQTSPFRRSNVVSASSSAAQQHNREVTSSSTDGTVPHMSSLQSSSVLPQVTNILQSDLSLPDTVTDTRSSPICSLLQVFKKYYYDLVKSLPMNDTLFIASLYSNNLLPGDMKDVIESISTKAQKATKFLDSIIKPTIESNDGTRFGVLLEVMKDSEDYNIRKLADTILCTINKARICQQKSRSKTGN
ncbi:uncharacterized protein [Dysidea avara]|uniref:uncharacterized protein n=1 Tax=Dysidea avara TaxID=196820 RepID=UPI003318DE4E